MKKRGWLPYVASALITGAALFLTAEVFSRIRHIPRDLREVTGKIAGTNAYDSWAVVDAYAAMGAKPGYRIDVHGKTKSVSSFGYISTPELPLAKPEGTIRVAFFGGSSTAGTGHLLPDEMTWPWKTIELLKMKFPDQKFDFVNAAMGSYSTFDSYGRFWSRVRFLSPDIVIVNHGWNDLYYFNKGAQDDMTLWRAKENREWHLRRKLKIYEPFFLDPVINMSSFLTYLRLRFSKQIAGGEWGVSLPVSTDFDARGLAVFRDNARLFREGAKLFGNKIFMVKQATLITADLPAEHRTKIRYDLHGFDHDAHVRAFKGIYKILDGEFPRQDIIDATSVSGNPAFFADWIHPTDLGTSRIAELVSGRVAEYLQGKLSKRQISMEKSRQ